jgi:ACS family tartrate transporter-like MFS transporter
VTPHAAAAVAKARRRLIPFLFLLYIVAYLDRINVGFAALQMNEALGFSARTFGFGAGIFFVSYVAFEIPSNLILARIGARIWIARIMITWGLVSSATMVVRTAAGFYVARFLLGAAEAGFLPGVIFYLTRWFPARERARTIAAFMAATLVAGVVGGPVSGALLALDGAAGLAGWQWLFLIEGLPAVVLGLVVLAVLPERPTDAAWLTADECRALVAGLAEGEDARGDETREETAQARLRVVSSGRLWRLAAVYFTIPVALYATSFWLPQIVKSASAAGNFVVGVLSAVPYVVAAVGMVIVGRHSDRTGERRWHIAVSALVGGAAFAASAVLHDVGPALVVLSIAMLGLASMFGPFWTLATSVASGSGAAVGIALVNSVGNIGGFVGPYVFGAIKDATGSFAIGLTFIGAVLVLGGALVLTVRDSSHVC